MKESILVLLGSILSLLLFGGPQGMAQEQPEIKTAHPVYKPSKKKECPECGLKSYWFYHCEGEYLCLDCVMVERAAVLSRLEDDKGQRQYMMRPFSSQKKYKCQDCDLILTQGYYDTKTRKPYCFFCAATRIKKISAREMDLIEKIQSKNIDKHWQQALEADCISGYEVFLKRYPESKYSHQAEKRLSVLRKDFLDQESKLTSKIPTLEQNANNANQKTDKKRTRLPKADKPVLTDAVLAELGKRVPLYGGAALLLAILLYILLSPGKEDK